MWRTAVTEAVNVSSNGGDINTMVLGSLCQELRIVDPLSSRQDLFSSHEHVVAVAVPEDDIELVPDIVRNGFDILGVVRVRHGVEGSDCKRILVEDVEVSLVLGSNQSSKKLLRWS